MSSASAIAAPPLALTIHHLSKAFGDTKALTDVELEIRTGEVHALVGQNGSGKSTLIKILAGFHDPDSGSVAEIHGEKFSLGGAAAPGVRFVHQDLGLISTLDAVDNLAFGIGYVTGAARRIKWREQRARARDALDAIGYKVDVTRPISQLSPVERTAVAIARSVQGIDDGSVSLLALDEPTAAMPSHEVDLLFEIVRHVTSRGVAVLYVSHHLKEIFSITDRVTVLRDGRNVGTRDTTSITSRALVEMMTGTVSDSWATVEHTSDGPEVLVTKDLGGNRLKTLSFSLRSGQVLGIAGTTGSGREEVCSLLFGAARRTGSVIVGGEELVAMRPDRTVAAGVGLVPADRRRDGLVLPFTVGENLTLPELKAFRRHGWLRSKEEGREVAREVSRFHVKTQSSATSVGSLSGGNQQKVVLGKWLRLGLKVLLLDEPTQGVDVAAKADLYRLIESAAGQGMAVVLCSSEDEEFERLCDDVIVLRGGEKVAVMHKPDITAQRVAQECLGLDATRRSLDEGTR